MSIIDADANVLVADPGHGRLKDYVIEHTGLTYYANRDEDLADRIRRRLSARGVNDCASYLQLLQDSREGNAEFDSLVSELTIGETYFFRHQEMFDALRNIILPDLIRRKRELCRLRIWSAGCATGPEAYSIAIMLKREFGHLIDGWEISILGTDINRESLACANEGRYEDWAFRGCPDELRTTCFDRDGDSWIIKPRYRQCVSFQYHNLVKHPIPSLVHNLAAFDLILCRNVMIYFSSQSIRQLAGQFHHCLADGGWFLVGHAEPNVDTFRAFHAVNVPGATLYQKAALTTSGDPPVVSLEKSREFLWPVSDAEVPASRPEAPSLESAGARQETSPTKGAPDQLEVIRDLADQGRCEAALQVCQKLLADDVLNPTVHFYCALVGEQAGDRAMTERSLRQAIYLDRNFALAHYYLGLCLQRSRNTRDAARSFRNVLDCLDRSQASQILLHGDGISVDALRELAETNLEILQAA
jgi:chemotaxis protein methyltransferase CheR